MSAQHRDLAAGLFDLTLDDPRLRQSPGRLREVARAREVAADFFVGPQSGPGRPPRPGRIFDAYAMAARAAIKR